MPLAEQIAKDILAMGGEVRGIPNAEGRIRPYGQGWQVDAELSRQGAHLAGGPAFLLLSGVKFEPGATVAGAMCDCCAGLALLIEAVRQHLQAKMCTSCSTKSA